jgi:malonyl-CoA O-methyltransferase
METEQSIIAPIIASLSPKRALDVGTGTGRYLPLLAAAGARRIVGLDLSLPMLGHNACGRPRVCADARRLPFPDRTFDLVCASLMAGDIEDLGPLVQEAARVLSPGGHLVYSDFHPSWNRERWRRTFRAVDGRQIVLKYFPHSIDQHLRWLEDAPFDVRTIREPRIGGRTKPVVVVFHAVKPHSVARPRC